MTDILHYLAVLFIGIVAGTTNVVAESGSILALPALILIGYDSLLANGTNRLSLFFINLFALKTFFNRDRAEFSRSMRFSLTAIPGSILGTLLAFEVHDQLYNTILGITLIIVVVSLYMNPNDDLAPFATEMPRNVVMLIVMFFIGFYGGFIQAGVGLLLMVALSALFHTNEIKKSIHKISIVFAYLFPTSLIFIWADKVDWTGALVLLFGYTLGGWFGGTHIVKSNDRLIRVILVFATVGMALKLLRVF